MKTYWHRITLIAFILLLCLGSSCSSSETEAKDSKITPASANKDSNTEQSSSEPNVSVQEQEEIEKAKEQAQEAETEVKAAKKEAEIQEKTVELEKKKAEVKLKEAEVAKKEAEIVKETAKSQEEVTEAAEKAKQKEKEALAAKEKVRLAEEKMLAAEEKARIAEEELKLAQERASAAEARNKERLNTIYRKLLQTGLIIFIGYLSIFVLVRIINHRIKDLKVRHLTRRNVVYILNILIVLYIVFLWVQNISAITVFLSVISAGVVFALQDTILSMAGWFLILVRRPFEVGDRVELGAVKGDVMDIRLFQTSLLEIGNWVGADQSIWNEIKLLVTFESDWKRAEEIMMQHGTEQAEGMEKVVKGKIIDMTKRYVIRYEKLTPIVYVDIKDSGVELTLRYLTEAKKRRTTQDALCRTILDDFEKEERVDFAYPTYRIVR